MEDLVRILSALANPKRLQILDWLKNPTKHFPPQVDGDLVDDGVCGVLIARKFDISQPATSQHMRYLVDAGLVNPKRIKNWTFYKRNEDGITKAKRLIGNSL